MEKTKSRRQKLDAIFSLFSISTSFYLSPFVHIASRPSKYPGEHHHIYKSLSVTDPIYHKKEFAVSAISAPFQITFFIIRVDSVMQTAFC